MITASSAYSVVVMFRGIIYIEDQVLDMKGLGDGESNGILIVNLIIITVNTTKMLKCNRSEILAFMIANLVSRPRARNVFPSNSPL